MTNNKISKSHHTAKQASWKLTKLHYIDSTYIEIAKLTEYEKNQRIRKCLTSYKKLCKIALTNFIQKRFARANVE